MWVVLRNAVPGGVVSINWFHKLIAALIAAILCTVMLGQNALAADATWQNGAIKYGDITLNGPKTANGNQPPNLPSGVQYYESTTGSDGKVTIVYFNPGTDVAQATGAQVATYRLNQGQYTPDGTARTISIDKQTEADAASNQDEEVSTCAVNQLGYIVCPLMGLMANMTDKVFGYLQMILEVKPLLDDREAPLYKAWAMMVGIANMAFIVAFLVVVYSYVSSAGISQYDIRKMIPRLIVAALMVNLSYYICALAVDLSNILGSTIQDMLLGIRSDFTNNQTMNRMALPSFGELVGAALASGGVVYYGALQLSAGGNVWLFVPILTAVAVAVFVTVAVLAARQAIITIFIIISPFAFVAFVLPGTQKYFDKWKDIFQTMLLMYPMFSFLFGGSQLAGYLIAQNADRFEILVIALFVSMAPLVVTPFLIKFSGSLLGRFAGMINNPSKGLIDKANNYARDQRDAKREQRLAENRPFAGLARWDDDRKRKFSARRSRYQSQIDAGFNRRNAAVNIEKWRAEEQAAAVDDTNRAAYAALKTKDNSMMREELSHRIARQSRSVQEGSVEAMVAELRTKEGASQLTSEGTALNGLSRHLHDLHQQEYVTSTRQAMANSIHSAELAGGVVGSDAMQRASAGIAGERGKAVATARAVSALYKDFGEGEEAVKTLMSSFKLSGAEIEQLAQRRGGPLVKTKPDGTTFTFDYNDDYTFSAAVDRLINEKGNFAQKQALIERSGEAEYADVRSTIAQGMLKTVSPVAPQLSGRFIDIVETTGVDPSNPRGVLQEISRDFILKGKFNQESMAKFDADGLKLMLEAIKDPNDRAGIPREMRLDYDARRAAFIELAKDTLKNEQLNGYIRDNTEEVLQSIAALKEI